MRRYIDGGLIQTPIPANSSIRRKPHSRRRHIWERVVDSWTRCPLWRDYLMFVTKLSRNDCSCALSPQSNLFNNTSSRFFLCDLLDALREARLTDVLCFTSECLRLGVIPWTYYTSECCLWLRGNWIYLALIIVSHGHVWVFWIILEDVCTGNITLFLPLEMNTRARGIREKSIGIYLRLSNKGDIIFNEAKCHSAQARAEVDGIAIDSVNFCL